LLSRLLERLLEPPREGVAACFLGVDRLLKDGLPPSCFFREDSLRLAQLRLVSALGLVVRHDPPEIEVDHQRGLAAGTRHFEFRLQSPHQFFPPSPSSPPANPPFSNAFASSIG